MVTVRNAHLRQSENGQFVTLELAGEIELVQSQRTGRFYATSKRCFIASTFSFDQAKLFIGQKMPGSIIRVACDPYEYTVPESGEVITLGHTYSYEPEEGPPAAVVERGNPLDHIADELASQMGDLS